MSAKYRPILQIFLKETRETRTSFANLDCRWENVFLMGIYFNIYLEKLIHQANDITDVI